MEEKRVRTAWRRYHQFRAAAFVAAAVGAFLALAVSVWAAHRALAEQPDLPVSFYVVAAALVVLAAITGWAIVRGLWRIVRRWKYEAWQ